MNKEKLIKILADQKEFFSRKRNLVERDIDIDSYLNTSQIVVISGVRRCGKSSLMYQIKEKLGLQAESFCYFNFDDERVMPDVELLNDIYALHIEKYRSEPVFFFDEIQVVQGWEKFVNRMYENGLKVYVTGSNSTLLSSEIATSLTGRNKVIELYPFSFAEYLRFLQHDYDLSNLSTKQQAHLLSDLNSYMEYGGFPLVVKETDLDIINAWFQDILYRDIVARFRLTRVDEIKRMALFLISNISKLFSYETLRKVSGVKSLSTVKDYLHYYEMSYMFYYLPKFDYSVRKQIANSRKVYVVDNAVANRLAFRFSENLGQLMENVVFLELKRRYKEIYYYSDKHECDFVIKEKNTLTEAIQVTYTLNEQNISRELSGLKETMQQLNIPQGTLIVYNNDISTEVVEKNISIEPLYKWILER